MTINHRDAIDSLKEIIARLELEHAEGSNIGKAWIHSARIVVEESQSAHKETAGAFVVCRHAWDFPAVVAQAGGTKPTN